MQGFIVSTIKQIYAMFIITHSIIFAIPFYLIVGILWMESKWGENFLSLQCKDKGEGGGLMIFTCKDSNS